MRCSASLKLNIASQRPRLQEKGIQYFLLQIQNKFLSLQNSSSMTGVTFETKQQKPSIVVYKYRVSTPPPDRFHTGILVRGTF